MSKIRRREPNDPNDAAEQELEERRRLFPTQKEYERAIERGMNIVLDPDDETDWYDWPEDTGC